MPGLSTSLVPQITDAYWMGEPVGQTATILYGSARRALVSSPGNDANYQAWLAKGFKAWPWPIDETGPVTVAALDAVLAAYGLPSTGIAAPTKASLADYANAKQWALATGGHNVTIDGTSYLFATDPTSLSLIAGKALRLQQANAPASVAWQFASGFATIAAADFVSASINIADWVQSTFTILETVLAAITSGSITTQDQIDAASWPAA